MDGYLSDVFQLPYEVHQGSVLHTFTWNFTRSLNRKIALRPSRCGWEINQLKVNHDNIELVMIKFETP